MVPPKSPLPQRHGLDAAWLCTEDRDGGRPRPWARMRDWLHMRLHEHLDVDVWIEEERFVYQDGRPVSTHDAYGPHTFIWFHRDLPEETPVPGEIRVLHRDERIVVIDKPPFLSSIPRGKHVLQSVVVRLRTQLGLPELTPMHRLDRVTSGLLMLTTERRWRGPYQMTFQNDEVSKRYRAIAPLREDLETPTTVKNHIYKQHGILRAEVLEHREPNSESIIQLLGELPAGVKPPSFPILPAEEPRKLAEYLLTPRTGKTHQLRLHLAGLGIPIVGDPLYPVTRDVAINDFRVPLQLLASELRFVDPIDGEPRHFVSERSMPLAGPAAEGPTAEGAAAEDSSNAEQSRARLDS